MPLVALERVSHTYPRGRLALRDIELRIESGERVALVGPSGAGKSTLLRCINGLVIPTEGRIEALGQDVRALSEQGERARMRFRRQIGMIFQEFALIERLPVLTNVLVGRLGYAPAAASLLHLFPAADVAIAREAVASVGLQGYEEPLVRHLSGGQKQRVGIARAMAQQPKLILGDEPTANLDVRTSDEVLALLVRLVAERQATLILSLHDVRAARRFCTRIVALKDGAIVWDGAPDSFTDSEIETIFYD